MTNSKISIIMPVYNGEKYIAQAIESVLAQTYKNFEIIIINDGSTDNSFEKIKPYLSLQNIKYIEQDNKGVAAARNSGIRASLGECIAFIDQDDFWHPKKLERQVEYLDTHPEVALVHSNFTYVGQDGKPLRARYPVWHTNVSGFCFAEVFAGNRIASVTTMFRRSCLDTVGWFREDVPGVDDYDLWLRISLRFRIGHINEALGFYRLHDANVSSDWQSQDEKRTRVLEGFLEQHPEVYRQLGHRFIKRRLYKLYREVADTYFQRNNHEAARMFYHKAIRIRPTSLGSYRRLSFGYLAPKHRRSINWYVHRLRRLFLPAGNRRSASTTDRDQ